MKYKDRRLKGDLSIIQWMHFVPGLRRMVRQHLGQQWGEKNDVQVKVEHINNTLLDTRAAAEVAAQSGHDLFFNLHPMASYEDQVINHAPIIQEIQQKVGQYGDLGKKSTYNPKTKKYFAVSDNYVPDPVVWRRDLWNGVGEAPCTWDHVRKAAPKLKATGHPIGIGQSQELDSNMALLAFMMCFGSFVQNAGNRPTLNTKTTIEAVKFMADIYKSEDTAIFGWNPASNNNYLYSGTASMILNAISATRTPEDQHLPFADDLCDLADPDRPARASRARARDGLLHRSGSSRRTRRTRRSSSSISASTTSRRRTLEALQLPELPRRVSVQGDPEDGRGRHTQAARQVHDADDDRREVHAQHRLSRARRTPRWTRSSRSTSSRRCSRRCRRAR